MSSTTPVVTSNLHPAASLKAYIALAGTIATGILASGLLGAVDNDSLIIRVLTGVAALATALATYQFPNAAVVPDGPSPDDQTVPYDDGFDPEVVDEEDTPLPLDEATDTADEGDEEEPDPMRRADLP
jgi:hypothetical protein